MDTKIDTENSPDYNCKYCNYNCSKNSDMKKHCLTTKHLKREKEYNMDTKNTTFKTYLFVINLEMDALRFMFIFIYIYYF